MWGIARYLLSQFATKSTSGFLGVDERAGEVGMFNLEAEKGSTMIAIAFFGGIVIGAGGVLSLLFWAARDPSPRPSIEERRQRHELFRQLIGPST